MVNKIPGEEWKPILGYKYLYFISNKGRVLSITGKNQKKNRESLTPFLLKQSKNSTGYYRVRLIGVDGKHKSLFVHRLVAEAFVENPNEYDVVNHKDFNPENNNAENLEWTTRYGNYKYSFDRGRFERTPEWRAHLKKTLSIVQGISVIGTNIKTGEEKRYENLNDVKKDGFQPSCVCLCCKGKQKKHKGFTWRYSNEK